MPHLAKTAVVLPSILWASAAMGGITVEPAAWQSTSSGVVVPADRRVTVPGQWSVEAPGTQAAPPQYWKVVETPSRSVTDGAADGAFQAEFGSVRGGRADACRDHEGLARQPGGGSAAAGSGQSPRTRGRTRARGPGDCLGMGIDRSVECWNWELARETRIQRERIRMDRGKSEGGILQRLGLPRPPRYRSCTSAGAIRQSPKGSIKYALHDPFW